MAPRKNKLVFLGWALHAAGLAGIATVLLVYQQGFSSMLESRRQQDLSEAGRLERILSRADEIRSRQEHLTQQLAVLEQRAEAIRRRIPEHPLEADFLHQISQAADAEGLSISDYQRGNITSLETHSQLEVRLRGSGNYASICGFLDRLSKLPRVARVQWMQVLTGETTYPLELNLMLYFGGKRPAAKG